MELFFLVPKIVAARKYVSIHRDEIERELAGEHGQFEWEWEEIIADEFGNEQYVPLRLNISCRDELAVSWSISLKLHCIRIDGIDWHRTFIDPNGSVQKGWHRHEFDQRSKSADKHRVPVVGLGLDISRTDFLIRTLSEMNVLLSGVDNGNYELFRTADFPDSEAE
jgi:hypothetical protein